MATVLYLHTMAPPGSASQHPYLWGYDRSDTNFSTKDTSRGVTPGDAAFYGTDVTSTYSLDTDANDTGTGQGLGCTTIAGPTAGVLMDGGFFSPPVAADVTISGTITFNMCAVESSMNANATIVAVLYRVDEQGALTLICKSSFGTELGTSNARKTWTATPTSTLVKKGHRLMLLMMADDATSLTMGSGFGVTVQTSGSSANLADSNVTLTETVTFTTSEPGGTTYYMRDTASDLGGIVNELSQTEGATNSTAIHTTINGPLTFPGDQWTETAGGSDIEWTTPPLDAFTLGGVVRCRFDRFAGGAIEKFATIPFACITCELAIVDGDGTNPVVWARSFTCDDAIAGTTWSQFITGPDISVGQGKRLRLRIFADDFPLTIGASGGTMASGTNRTLRYGGAAASGYEAYLKFEQTITEASGPTTRDLTATMAGSGALPGTPLTNRRNLTASMAGSAALTGALSHRWSLAASMAGSGTLAGTLTHRKSLTASMAGTGAFPTATLRARRALPVTMAGTGALIPTLRANRALPVTMAGSGVLSPGLTARRPLSASMAGSAALTANLTKGSTGTTRDLVASLAGSSALAGGLTRSRPVTASMAGTATLTGSLSARRAVAATTAGAGAITAALIRAHPFTVTIPGSGTLAAVVRARRALTPTLAGTGALVPSLSARRGLTASMAGSGVLWASLGAGIKALLATAAGQGALIVALTRSRSLTAAFAGTGSTTAALTAQRAVAGLLGGSGTFAATLNRWATLTATLPGTGSLAAGLNGRFNLVAVLPGTGALDVALTDVRQLLATLAGSGSITAGLTNYGPTPFLDVAGVMDGVGSLTALLTARRTMLAPFGGEGALTAAVLRNRRLVAVMAGRGALIYTPPLHLVQMADWWLGVAGMRYARIESEPDPAGLVVLLEDEALVTP